MTDVLSVKSKGFDSGARYLNKRLNNIESTYAEGLAQVGSRGFVLNDSTFSVLDSNGYEVFKASPDGVWVTGHDGKKLMSVDDTGLSITGTFAAFDAAGSEVFYAGEDGVRIKVQAGIYATPEEVLAAQQAAGEAKSAADAALAEVEANATAIAAANQAAANAAQAAQSAADLAGVKGEVIFQAGEPLFQQRLTQNLWIDTDEGNAPKRWDGSEWVAVTDEAVVNAANKAAAAQEAATAAMNKALEPADEIAIPKPGTTTPYITGNPADGLNVNNSGNVEVFHSGLDGTRILGTFTAKDATGKEIFYAGPDGVRMQTKSDVMVTPEQFEAYKIEQLAQSTSAADLVINGTGVLRDNTNFKQFTWIGADTPTGAVGSFYTQPSPQTALADEFIPYNPSKAYRFSWKMRQVQASTTAKAYGLIAPYDNLGYVIDPSMYMRRQDTLTELAAELKPGDTVIKLTSAAEWFGSTAKPAGTATHNRRIIFWNYRDANGKLWEADSYSRNVSPVDFWADGGVNLATNTITLREPFPLTWGTIPAGTKVANGSRGGTYIYTPSLSNGIVPDAWTQYGDTLPANPPRPGIGASATWGTLPAATARIKIGWLVNRVTDGSVSQHAVAGVSFSDALAAQAAAENAEFLANQPADEILIKNGATTVVKGDSTTGLNTYASGVEVFHAGLDGVRMVGSLTSKDTNGNVIFSAGSGGAYFAGDLKSVGANGSVHIKQSLYGGNSKYYGIRFQSDTNERASADIKAWSGGEFSLRNGPGWIQGGVVNYSESGVALTSGWVPGSKGGFSRGEVAIGGNDIAINIARSPKVDGAVTTAPASMVLSDREQSWLHSANLLHVMSNTCVTVAHRDTAGVPRGVLQLDADSAWMQTSDTRGNTLSRLLTNRDGAWLSGALNVDISAPPADGKIDLTCGSRYVGFHMKKRSNNFGWYEFLNLPVVSSAANAYIDPNNTLCKTGSARKYKRDIQDMDPGLIKSVYKLRPRTWIDWLAEDDSTAPRIPGFVAEEVQEAGLDLFVTRDTDGEIEGLMYDRIAAAQQLVILELEKRLSALEERTAQ